MALKHRPAALLATALALCALLLAPAAASAIVRGVMPNCKVATAAASAIPREAPTARLGRAAVCLINRQRAARGLPRLRINPKLSRAARRHTRDMVRRRYFSHTSPRGSDMLGRVKRTGYLNGNFSWTVGENIAWGTRRLGSPMRIVQAWMHSPGHRANLLNGRFRELGIGVVAAGPTPTELAAATYTTTFGGRR